MPDIALTWDAANGVADWTLGADDIATGDDLLTAVIISLFTDAPATADYVPRDGDRRGWWADPYAGITLGSNLWQIGRATKTTATLTLARQSAARALQWLVDDGVAATVDVQAEWQGSETPRLAMAITITAPDGTARPFRFSWAWSASSLI